MAEQIMTRNRERYGFLVGTTGLNQTEYRLFYDAAVLLCGEIQCLPAYETFIKSCKESEIEQSKTEIARSELFGLHVLPRVFRDTRYANAQDAYRPFNVLCRELLRVALEPSKAVVYLESVKTKLEGKPYKRFMSQLGGMMWKDVALFKTYGKLTKNKPVHMQFSEQRLANAISEVLIELGITKETEVFPEKVQRYMNTVEIYIFDNVDAQTVEKFLSAYMKVFGSV
jgi:hypothetical protein